MNKVDSLNNLAILWIYLMPRTLRVHVKKGTKRSKMIKNGSKRVLYAYDMRTYRRLWRISLSLNVGVSATFKGKTKN